jgi:protein YibB
MSNKTLNSNNDITIVTAFFDIGRGNLPQTKHGRVLPHYQHRSVDQYFDFFKKQAVLDNEMIIYTTKDFAERIYNIRKDAGHEFKTKVVVLESYMPNGLEDIKTKVSAIMDSPDYYNKVVNPQLIEYWHADYVLVNIFKSLYVCHAIANDYITSPVTAWIDFGYCRTDTTVPPSKKWTYNFDPEKIHFFNIKEIDEERPIDDIIYTGDVYIQGCHMVAGTKKWELVKDLVLGSLNILLKNNLIDDDQTLLLMSYMTKPEEFELRYVDPKDWFIMFKDYNLNV